MRGLEKHFHQAHDALVAARREPPSLEMARRLDQILELASKPHLHAERLRAGRVVELLEHIGGKEAEQILRDTARGDPLAYVTTAALEAWCRIERLRE